MFCTECGADEKTDGVKGAHAFLADARMRIRHPRYKALLLSSLERVPKNGHRVNLRTEIRLRRRGTLPGVVGLTTFTLGGYAPSGIAREEPGAHTITFYSQLLDKLTDRAVTAVMAHELAHAWLNEHIRPEASNAREEDADMLAEMWGFGPELEALAAETEPVNVQGQAQTDHC